MKAYFAALAALVSVLTGTASFAQTQRALLIGINTYEPAGTTAEHPANCTYGRCGVIKFNNLDGAVNDAQSMADLLTTEFGFPAKNVVLLTNPAPPQPKPGVTVLPASDTTRDGILAAMQKYLVDLPQKGDTVVFYDASHGSLRVNTKGNNTKMKVLVAGQYVPADSTLVASDAYKGGYDVRDRELTRIFNAALDKGVHLTVIFDSCHSGSISRGVGPQYTERDLAFDQRDIDEAPDTATPPSERKDNPALILSAAQQSQTAKEAPLAPGTTEPHGAFTAALIETLRTMPPDTPASLVYERVKAVLEGSSVPDQDPDLDATEARREQPLFGGTAAKSNKVRTAAIGTDSDGNITLDIGLAAGLGAGTEFTSENPDSQGKPIVLRISDLKGIARSTAEIVSPAGAKVSPGQFFDLTKWVPADSQPLRFWLWPATLSEDQILAAAMQVQASGATLVSDPAEQQWTHMLNWDGTNWMLKDASADSPVSLGSTLTAAALKQHLPAGARLWANLPPSRELAAKLKPAVNSAVQSADNMAAANYALTGVVTENGPAYAWYHKSELAAGPPSPNAPPHSPGCSATSQYPVRTNWIPVGSAADIDPSGDKLMGFALRLAKVHDWLELANNPVDASSLEYYSLALVPAAGSTPLSTEQTTHQGDELKMVLTADDKIIEKRWVYVLDIDCTGAGTLLYPGNYTGNQYGDEGDVGKVLPLRGAPTLRIGKPFGVDTLIMLATDQPLSDPFALNFEGVGTRGATRGTSSPLEKLLNQASAGTRGPVPEVPTNWSIETTTVHSAPKTTSP